MADTKISALSAAAALDGTEALPVVQSAATVKALVSAIRTYILQVAANTWTKAQTIASGTLTDPATGFTLTQTWNDAADTFTGMLINITSTASAAASRFYSIQLAGTDVWYMTKAGMLTFRAAGINDLLTIGGTASGNISYASNATGIHYQLIGDTTSSGGPMALRMGSTGVIAFNSLAALNSGSLDVGIARTAAGQLRVTNGTTGVGVCKALRYISVAGAGASYATAGAQTYTAADILTGTIVRDCAGAGRTDVLPTAALLVGAITGAAIGDTIECWIVNGSDAAEVITIDAGAGGGFDTNQTAASRVIGQNTSKLIRIRLTNVTGASEAYVAYL